MPLTFPLSAPPAVQAVEISLEVAQSAERPAPVKRQYTAEQLEAREAAAERRKAASAEKRKAAAEKEAEKAAEMSEAEVNIWHSRPANMRHLSVAEYNDHVRRRKEAQVYERMERCREAERSEAERREAEQRPPLPPREERLANLRMEREVALDEAGRPFQHFGGPCKEVCMPVGRRCVSADGERLYGCVPLSWSREYFEKPRENLTLQSGRYYYVLPACLHLGLCPQQGCDPMCHGHPDGDDEYFVECPCVPAIAVLLHGFGLPLLCCGQMDEPWHGETSKTWFCWWDDCKYACWEVAEAIKREEKAEKDRIAYDYARSLEIKSSGAD